MAGGLKLRIYVEEGLYYLYSENKGADQLRSYCAADLRLCFGICKKNVFLITRLIYYLIAYWVIFHILLLSADNNLVQIFCHLLH